jgi:hypothetical protein
MMKDGGQPNDRCVRIDGLTNAVFVVIKKGWLRKTQPAMRKGTHDVEESQ